MSASTRMLPPGERPQLAYAQIFSMLYEGLVPYITCFVSRSSHITDYKDVKEAFKTGFANAFQPKGIGITKDDFEKFSRLMFVKAGNSKIINLTADEREQLHKLGIMPVADLTTRDLVAHFFNRKFVEDFIIKETDAKYRNELNQLLDTVYGVITAAIYSIQDEAFLQKFNKAGTALQKDMGEQPMLSALDLLFQSSAQALDMINANLIKIKKKTSQQLTLTSGLTKMRNGSMIAGAEYTKNLEEVKKQEQLEQQQQAHQLELERVQAERLAAETLAEEQLREASRKAEILAEEKIQIQEAHHRELQILRESPSHSSNNDVSPTVVNIAPNGEEARKLKAENISLKQQAVNNRIALMTAEARHMNVDKKSLTAIYNDLIAQMQSGKANEQSLVDGLLKWEKSALYYVENKKEMPAESNTSSPSVFSSLGQALGWSKKISPAQNAALKNDLKEILRHCIILMEHAKTTKEPTQECLKEQLRGLMQHMKNLNERHSKEHIEEGTVSKQLTQLAATMVAYATKEFAYDFTYKQFRSTKSSGDK